MDDCGKQKCDHNHVINVASFFFLMRSYVLCTRFNKGAAVSVVDCFLLCCIYLPQQMGLLESIQLDLFIGKLIHGMKKHDT